MTKDDLTTAEAAQYLRPAVTVRRVRAMLKQRKFPNAQLRGRDWLIPRADLDAENKRRGA